jgi:hypothetical protein
VSPQLGDDVFDRFGGGFRSFFVADADQPQKCSPTSRTTLRRSGSAPK